MRQRKVRRELERIEAELEKEIYNAMKGRIEDEYYGRCAARFDDLLRQGIIAGERKWTGVVF